jgi:hypothetical protein
VKIQITQTEKSTLKSCASKLLLKQVQTLTVVLGLAALGFGVARANDLFNPDLDIISVGPQNNPSPTGWQIDASKSLSGSGYMDGADSETFCNVQQPGGYGLFFKPFAGTTNGGVNDLLTVNFYQDNPSAAGAKCTLSGYAAGEANFCAFFPPPPGAPQAQALFVIEFLDNANTVIASNAFNLVTAGLPSGGAGSMVQFMTPQFTAPAGTVTVRAGASLLNAYSTTGSQSFFVDAFDLETIAPAGLPVITNQPTATTAPLGGTAIFHVGVSNSLGAGYQWQFENVDLVNGGGISGVTSPMLTITGVTTNNIGHYRVKVTNGTGTVPSQSVLLALDTFNFYPVVALYGVIGSTYQLSYSTTVAGTYIPLSTNTLTMSPQYVIDPTSPGNNTRFYQATFLH